MTADVLYLAWNRREFTEFTFTKLLENTDWNLVRQLVVYDDGSEDGTKEFLYDAIHGCPVEYHLVETRNVGPVEIMNRFVAENEPDWFFKCDNDIVLPPGYLRTMLPVAEANPWLDAFGCEAGRTTLPALDEFGVASVDACPYPYGVEGGSHIGGVGLIRHSTLARRPRLKANGEGNRYGWTEFQGQWKLGCGWIQPDIPVCSLDQVPFDPWQSLALRYQEMGWSRVSMPGQYHARWMARYWNWWHPQDETGDGEAVT